MFVTFLAGMGWVAQYALENGDARRLSHGFNFKGKLCGVSPGFEHKPYLYYCPNGAIIPGSTPPMPSSAPSQNTRSAGSAVIRGDNTPWLMFQFANKMATMCPC